MHKETNLCITEKSVQKNALTAGVVVGTLQFIGYWTGHYLPSSTTMTQFTFSLLTSLGVTTLLTGLNKTSAARRGVFASMNIASHTIAAGTLALIMYPLEKIAGFAAGLLKMLIRAFDATRQSETDVNTAYRAGERLGSSEDLVKGVNPSPQAVPPSTWYEELQKKAQIQ